MSLQTRALIVYKETKMTTVDPLNLGASQEQTSKPDAEYEMKSSILREKECTDSCLLGSAGVYQSDYKPGLSPVLDYWKKHSKLTVAPNFACFTKVGQVSSKHVKQSVLIPEPSCGQPLN